MACSSPGSPPFADALAEVLGGRWASRAGSGWSKFSRSRPAAPPAPQDLLPLGALPALPGCGPSAQSAGAHSSAPTPGSHLCFSQTTGQGHHPSVRAPQQLRPPPQQVGWSGLWPPAPASGCAVPKAGLSIHTAPRTNEDTAGSPVVLAAGETGPAAWRFPRVSRFPPFSPDARLIPGGRSGPGWLDFLPPSAHSGPGPPADHE